MSTIRGMVAVASRIRSQKGCIYVGFDLHRPQPGIHVPQWFPRTRRCQRMSPAGRIPCGVLTFPLASPPPPLCFLDGQRNSLTATYRTFQPLHPSTARFHGTRTSSNPHVYGIRSPRPFCPELNF